MNLLECHWKRMPADDDMKRSTNRLLTSALVVGIIAIATTWHLSQLVLIQQPADIGANDHAAMATAATTKTASQTSAQDAAAMVDDGGTNQGGTKHDPANNGNASPIKIVVDEEIHETEIPSEARDEGGVAALGEVNSGEEGKTWENEHHESNAANAATDTSANAGTASVHPNHETLTPTGLGPLIPHLLDVDGAPAAYYMLPPPSLTSGDISSAKGPTGILFFFHGCKHSGVDFFILPEDRLVAHEVLQRNLAVLSLSASKKSACWHADDVPLIRKQVDAFSKATGLKIANNNNGNEEDNEDDGSDALPLYAMGMSMGVTAVFYVEEMYDFASMALYTTYHSIDDSEYDDEEGNDDSAYPPSIWIHMPRDEYTHANMKHNFEVLRDTQSKYEEIEIHPRPFSEERCQQRLPELGTEGCKELVRAFADQGFVSRGSGRVLRRPDRGLIASTLAGLGLNDIASYVERHGGNPNEFMQLHLSHEQAYAQHDTSSNLYGSWPRSSFLGRTWLWASIEQEIAYCYARHEMVSESRNEVLDFLQQKAA